MSSTVRPEEFGKEHGLIHEVVVTGRKVGADHEFWARLAHDEEIFRQVVSLVRGEAAVLEDFFLFTTSALTLNELWERNQDLFFQGSDRWWKDQSFANKEGKVGKLLLRTSAAPGSFSKTWSEQQRLLSDGEFVPTMRDLVEGMIAYYRATGKRLFFDYWVRSQDVSSDGRRVDVGFSSDGVGVGNYWDDDRDSDVGLAVARKSV